MPTRRGRRSADAMLLMALACGATVEAAAMKAGVSPGHGLPTLTGTGLRPPPAKGA